VNEAPPGPRGHGGFRRRAPITATAVTAIAAIFVLFALPPLLAPQNFPSDDSLFYLQVARHIAAGHGSTFNTVTPTNGYHPLWMGPCVAAAWLSHGDPTLLLRVTFALQILLAAGCLLLFRAVARRLAVRAWPLGIPILATFFLTGMFGSEAHLNGACVLASLLLLLRVQERPVPRDSILLGVLIGLTVLARLDNAFLAVAMLVGIARSRVRGPSRIGTVARVAVPATLVMLPYLLWNLIGFGHVVPISGAIKSTFPNVVGDIRNLGALGLVTCVIALAAGAAALFGRAGGGRRLVMGVMSAGALAQGLYIVLFTNHNTHWSWYYVPGTLLATLVACIVADAAVARNVVLRSRAVALLGIALLTTAGIARGWARFLNSGASSHNQFLVRFLPATASERWEIQFARAMERALPAGAGVLVFDYPGHLAFYSSLRIVPADGLVGDYRSDADLRRRGLGGFLSDHRIGFYVGRGLDPPDSCRAETIFAPVERADVGALILCPGNLLTTAATAVRGAPAPDVGLFRIGGVAEARGAQPPPPVKHGALW